jgi:hypothetical protein
MVKGDGRGGKRENAGRPRKRFIVELDDVLQAKLKEQYDAWVAWDAENLPSEDRRSQTLAEFLEHEVKYLIEKGKFGP